MTAVMFAGCAADVPEQAARAPDQKVARVQPAVAPNAAPDCDEMAKAAPRVAQRRAQPRRTVRPESEDMVVVTVSWTEEETAIAARPALSSSPREGVFTPSLALSGLAERSSL